MCLAVALKIDEIDFSIGKVLRSEHQVIAELQKIFREASPESDSDLDGQLFWKKKK